MLAYKLTDHKMQTYKQTQWGENITHEASGKGDLCGDGWIHTYTDPLLSVLLNPIHANFPNPILWICEASGKSKSDRGLKVGYTKVTTVNQISLPIIYVNQKVRFAILCAKEVYKNQDWLEWANNWLIGNTSAAYDAAYDAAYAAYAADAAYAAYAAYAADAAPLDLIAIAKKAII